MSKKAKISSLVAMIAVIIGLLAWYLATHSIPVLEPGGQLGKQERELIIIGCSLAVIVVVPTFALTIWIAWKYREGNHDETTKYKPDFDHSRLFESIWWGIPIVIIGILSYFAWHSAHTLNPYRQLVSTKKQLVVQVVNMDWKWLFIYPEQGVASVNLAEIPVNTPVDFQVTSDTIMNSFWVPGLGGQVYAMPGMVTQLHEMADKTGDFFGSPANIAGKGFSRMDFTVRSASDKDFSNWIAKARQSNRPLNSASYAKLARPSDSVPVSYYSSVPQNFLYNLAEKYMMPMKVDQQSASKVNSPMEMK